MQARPSMLERVMGIEPTLLAWKARALPLSYTRTLNNIGNLVLSNFLNNFTLKYLYQTGFKITILFIKYYTITCKFLSYKQR